MLLQMARFVVNKTIANIKMCRYLMKCAKLARNQQSSTGAHTTPIIAYLFEAPERRSSISPGSDRHWPMAKAFDHLARRLIFRAYDRLEQLQTSGGMGKEEAWNEVSIDLAKVSSASKM
jgi:hypothetical protein